MERKKGMSDGYKTILVIEDDEDLSSCIRLFLEDQQYSVFEAHDGNEALTLFEERQPDMVLIDLILPGMDGFTVMSKILETHPDFPILVVSGTGDIKDAVQALKMGAWDFILKPISNFQVLLHAVDMAGERSRLLTENQRYVPVDFSPVRPPAWPRRKSPPGRLPHAPGPGPGFPG